MENTRQISRGFTLLELLIALSIVILLISISVPRFEYAREKHKSDALIGMIYQTFQFAKSTAISRRKTVYFCGTNTLSSCDKQFNKYLIVFIDSDDDKNPSAEEIIYQQHLSIGSGFVETRASFGNSYTSIAPRGTSSLSGSMLYCPGNGKSKYASRVTWNRTARPYKARDGDGDGNIDDVNDRFIDCE